MKLTKNLRFAAVGVVSLVLVSGVSVAASAATLLPSDGPVYVYDTNSALGAAGYSWAWDEDAFGSASATDVNAMLACPAASTGVSIFLSDPGTERTPLTWKAYAAGAFNGASTNVLNSFLVPDALVNGAGAGVKAAGGTFSLGVACTTNNGVTVVGAFFNTIVVTPVTGAYTIAAGPTAPVAPGPQNGTVELAPTTVAAVNGVLALTVPAGAAAIFAAPTLVNGVSTTVGTLGAVTVNDGRFSTAQGWDLSANVADFVNSTDATNTISRVQLGIAPSVTAAGTTATNVTAGAPQVAGSTVYPVKMASGAASNTTGNSVIDAGLTFVAPAAKAAGTYTSTMTLTVVSK